MSAVDYSIAGWVRRVPSLQWARDDAARAATPDALPEVLLASRPLAEVHRLDLALFEVFEEAALRVSGALVRRAPTPEALAFSAQQTLDEARHHEQFRARHLLARAAAGLPAHGGTAAILIPPLQRFLDHCYEVADAGSFVEALALMNLVLEGMAFPLYAYEQRYWAPVDPALAALVKGAFADETRHCAFGARTVRELLASDPERRARVTKLAREARSAMAEVFRYYVARFVGLFDAVARRHRELFAGAELAPGRLIADTPYEEQVRMIHHSIDTEHARLLAKAGLT
ncbi:MAG: hypothetical protein JNK82_21440 [Myxococcaceae bacterium]|nr:hypothetical protein [Myxococcaceae bacterium]